MKAKQYKPRRFRTTLLPAYVLYIKGKLDSKKGTTAVEYINQQREDREKENFERQERNRKEREAFKAKKKKKFKIKSVLTLSSVLILITANIAYIILALSLFQICSGKHTLKMETSCVYPHIQSHS